MAGQGTKNLEAAWDETIEHAKRLTPLLYIGTILPVFRSNLWSWVAITLH